LASSRTIIDQSSTSRTLSTSRNNRRLKATITS
jgi:hypothetical protein